MKPLARKNGFTLLEILIAVTIFSIISSVVYASYFAACQSARRCRTKMARSQQARSLLNQITRQIRCCYLPPTLNPAPAVEKTTTTTNLRENPPPYFSGGTDRPDGLILQLTTTAPYRPDKKLPAGPFHVAYKYDAPNQTLYYQQQKFVPLSKNLPPSENWTALAQNVSYIELTFFDGTRPLAAWDFQEKKGPPQAVKINLYLSAANHEPVMFSTVAPVASAPPGTVSPNDEK